MSWDDLASLAVDYIALGDLHRFRSGDELEGLPACYPGSFAAVDWTERGLRGPALVELEPGCAPVITRLSSGVREVAEPVAIDVSGYETDLEVVDHVVHRLESAYPIVILEGEPSFPLDAEVISGALEERYGAASVVDRSRFFAVERLEEIAAQNTVAGHVARLGLEAVGAATSSDEREAAEQGLRIALRAMEVS